MKKIDKILAGDDIVFALMQELYKGVTSTYKELADDAKENIENLKLPTEYKTEFFEKIDDEVWYYQNLYEQGKI